LFLNQTGIRGGSSFFLGGYKIWFFCVKKKVGRSWVLILRLVPFDALTLAEQFFPLSFSHYDQGEAGINDFLGGFFYKIWKTNCKKSLRVFKLERWDKKGIARTDEDYRRFKPNRGSGGSFHFFWGGQNLVFCVQKKVGRSWVLILRLVPFDALTLAEQFFPLSFSHYDQGEAGINDFLGGFFYKIWKTNCKKSLRVFKLEGWDKKGNVPTDEDYRRFKPNRGSGGFFNFFSILQWTAYAHHVK
jgi:hypothetical protein